MPPISLSPSPMAQEISPSPTTAATKTSFSSSIAATFEVSALGNSLSCSETTTASETTMRRSWQYPWTTSKALEQ